MRVLFGIRTKLMKQDKCSFISWIIILILICIFFFITLLVFFFYLAFHSSSKDDEPWFDSYQSIPKSNMYLNIKKFLKIRIEKDILLDDLNKTKINNNFLQNCEKEKESQICLDLKQNNSNILNEEKINILPNITIYKDEDENEGRKKYERYLCLIFSLEFVLICNSFIKSMITEKKYKINLFFKYRGVSKAKFFLVWLFIYFYICFFLVFMITLSFIIFKNYESEADGMFIIMDLELLFIFLFFSIYIFFFSYLCFKLFDNLKSCHLLIQILNFLLLSIGFGLSFVNSRVIKLPFIIFPNINIFYAFDIYSNFYEGFLNGENHKFRGIFYKESLLFFIIQFVLLILLILFSDFFKYKCCCDNNPNIGQINQNNLNHHLIEENENEDLLISTNHHQELTMKEKQQKNENKCLKISGVSKRYDTINIVNNFNLELFPDEIFCLYGLDGNGKTTLIKMILGLISPDEGDITLDGVSLPKNKHLIYKNISFCPQENILMENFSIRDNLSYSYKLNGMKDKIDEIQEIINYFNLNEEPCKNLSEEQKRIACFSLAITENKKVLIFDEPTRGIAEEDKKKIWDLIKCNQGNKIILVATNSLEEAEKFGTRIGIMRNGNLICSGERNYLKMNYNNGNEINIKLLINVSEFNENNEAEIFEKIEEYNSNSEIKKISKEIILINIKDSKNISQINNFIKEIKDKNIIMDYEIENISLEQIFNKNNLTNLKV